MLRLHQSGSLNNDTISVLEDKVESVYTVSSGAQIYSVVCMDSGAMFNVKESEEEIVRAIQTWKESSKAQS